MAAARKNQRRRDRNRRVIRRTVWTVIGTAAAITVVAGTWFVVDWANRPWPDAEAAAGEATTTPATTPTPTPTPELSEAQQLLAASTDPRACAITFAGDGIDLAPALETEGLLYAALPIPDREGLVFAGWYDTAEAAAARDIPARINGADAVACTDRERTVHAAWVSPEENATAETRIPILMYHQFTTKPEGESGWLRLNYTLASDWDAHLAYIAEQQFYLPTWPELSAFIDGRLYLPDHSVIVTDDDADPTWLELAVPLVDEHRVMTTSFAITVNGAGPDITPYVLKRSHTHDMHTAGADGKGRIVNWTHDEIVSDLETSAAVLGGTKEVIAYPYGHYDEAAKQAVADAGFELARTIEQGYVSIGTDKLALPCVRMNFGMTVADLAGYIG